MYVIDRESGGDPNAQNPSSASGLLQLMSIHWSGRFDPFKPKANLSYGYKLYRGSGWAPWAL
jgi:soluble lytic murein transglycosylase-like protein